MTIINYTNTESIIAGVPFTWGTGRRWYIKSTNGDIVGLHNGGVSKEAEHEVRSYDNFKYAKELEIK